MFKNLKTFAPFYSKSPPPADFTPPYDFLGLEILHQQLKVGGVSALFNLSLCLPLKVAVFFFLILFIYIKNTNFSNRNNNNKT
jgi:hypothetical protein